MNPAFLQRQPASSVRCQDNREAGPAPAPAVLWQRLAGILLIAALTCAGLTPRADAQEKPKPDAPPFDEATAAAWMKADAQVGWMGINKDGFLEFRTQKEPLSAATPAFRFAFWPENVLAKLPDPARPFGLVLRGTQVTDAGLKELAGLKSLQSLGLSFTQVTDAGLKELAGLKSLQSLGLSSQVTDAGLKELAGLKSLQSLGLSFTQVTGAGVAELRKALPGCQIFR